MFININTRIYLLILNVSTCILCTIIYIAKQLIFQKVESIDSFKVTRTNLVYVFNNSSGLFYCSFPIVSIINLWRLATSVSWIDVKNRCAVVCQGDCILFRVSRWIPSRVLAISSFGGSVPTNGTTDAGAIRLHALAAVNRVVGWMTTYLNVKHGPRWRTQSGDKAAAAKWGIDLRSDF